MNDNELKIITDNYSIYHGDCLEVMDKLIGEGVKVDAIITDPPYGTTACKWDSVIPFDDMWDRLKKLIKPNGAIVLFGSEPFSSALRMSNIKGFKYDWIWDKKAVSNPQLAKKQPLKNFELISVFGTDKRGINYFPQGLIKIDNPKIKRTKNTDTEMLGHIKRKDYVQTHTNYPKAFLQYSRPSKNVHPTQKPVDLLEYLIKTYTNEGELILDFTMGSGSTGVACLNTNRKFIGIELDEKYFEIAKKRLEEVKQISFFNT